MQKTRFSLFLLVALSAILLTGCAGVPSNEVIEASDSGKAPLIRPAEGPILAPLPELGVGAKMQQISFAQVPGWQQDNVSQALPALLQSCISLVRRPAWASACAAAQHVGISDTSSARAYFETYFIPYKLSTPDGEGVGLLTSYYEPILMGSLTRTSEFNIPLYDTPKDLLTVDLSDVYPELKGARVRGQLKDNKIVPYLTRAQIAEAVRPVSNVVAWLNDPIDAFFLQVQGSGLIKLAGTGDMIRVSYADQNGYPYKSIGKYLIDKGEMTLPQASAQGIKNWAKRHPDRTNELLNANPSYIFFKAQKINSATTGPTGALGVPLTQGRSVAVDPQFIPLGVPLFIATTLPGSERPLQRLVMAQDTGSAIKGPLRADLFWGTGVEAGEAAGRMKQKNELWILLPKQVGAR